MIYCIPATSGDMSVQPEILERAVLYVSWAAAALCSHCPTFICSQYRAPMPQHGCAYLTIPTHCI